MTRPVLAYYDMGPGVVAFSSTRKGGCSTGLHGGFNVNQYCGDNPGAVMQNREALCAELGIDGHRLVMPHQVHGTVIRQVAADFLLLPEAVQQMILEGVDAVMTDVPRVCIGVSTADCIPILLYDAEHRACCAVHAGWRGTAQSIAAKAVAAMQLTYGTHPATMQACIGPGISLEHFEVGDEVYRVFAENGFDMDRISRRYEKWHIDLWECNRMQLESAGMNPQNIHIAGVCTYSRAGEYFSARRLGQLSGRVFTGIFVR